MFKVFELFEGRFIQTRIKEHSFYGLYENILSVSLLLTCKTFSNLSAICIKLEEPFLFKVDN